MHNSCIGLSCNEKFSSLDEGVVSSDNRSFIPLMKNTIVLSDNTVTVHESKFLRLGWSELDRLRIIGPG